MDPSKRNLLKLLGGILSTPLMTKLLPFLAKEGADVVEGIKQLRNTSTNELTLLKVLNNLEILQLICLIGFLVLLKNS